jgi:hypothetical protein
MDRASRALCEGGETGRNKSASQRLDIIRSVGLNARGMTVWLRIRLENGLKSGSRIESFADVISAASMILLAFNVSSSLARPISAAAHRIGKGKY